jgi:CubicO group peptidase (beta-lactamase class C family)
MKIFQSTTQTILLILLFIFSAAAQSNKNYDELDNYIAEAVKDFEIPGLVVGIIKDGNVVFTKGYGYRNIETKAPVTPETIFGLASVSKAFTAASIGILVDEGKLDWDDKVTEHLPWFKLYDPYITSEITVRDLLCHRSGLATYDGDLLWYGTDYDRKEIVRRIRYLPLKNPFRGKYGYQNIMFIAAGLVVEAVSGKSWDEFVKEKIFTPLEMNSTNTSNNYFSKDADWSLPYYNGKVIEMLNYDNAGPAASINSNVDDLTKWIQMWLNNGKYNDKQILSENSVSVITSANMVLPSPANTEKFGTHFRNYGLGWNLWDYSGRKIIEHSGGLPGVHTKVCFVPDDQLGIIILSNQINGLINPLLNKILDFHLNENNIDYAAESFKRIKEREEKEKPEEKENIISSENSLNLPPESYTGIYEDKMYGKAEVVFTNNELVLKFLPAEKLFSTKLEHRHFNTFRIKFTDPFLPEGFVTFDMNSKGEISGFKIDLPNPDFHFYNLNFIKK